ncbi:hypothetical protein CHM34_07250 [Paludifilum halophilum]|uniref:Uncharacterized protein n=1 Tax=Paludifilum halophilum TaxID=1642702 RepID=A0A235B6I8_9BACL|nr:hypothetical protein CHM34_07250 [Paludifilum halophilum]
MKGGNRVIHYGKHQHHIKFVRTSQRSGNFYPQSTGVWIFFVHRDEFVDNMGITPWIIFWIKESDPHVDNKSVDQADSSVGYPHVDTSFSFS